MLLIPNRDIVLPVPANSGAGIGTLRNVTGDIRRARVFYSRALSYHLNGGWAGHRKVRWLPVTPVVPTSFQSTTMRLEPLVVGLNPVTGGCLLWLTIPIQTHIQLLAVPFNATTDFTVLADHCENFAETLIENDDPILEMALCGRLPTPA